MNYPKDYINKVIQGDCLEVMKDIPNNNSFLIITDPPYNIGIKYENGKDDLTEHEYSKMFNLFKGYRSIFIHYPEDTIKYICPSLGIPREIVSWVYNSNLPKQHRLISWFNCNPNFKKILQPYKNPTVSKIKNRISQGTPIYDWWNINLVKNTSKEKVKYKNQIPEEIIYRIIKTTAVKDNIIIDPYCGTGTTCAVAKKLGFNYIGIDKSPISIKLSRERLAQIELFTPKSKIDLIQGDVFNDK